VPEAGFFAAVLHKVAGVINERYKDGQMVDVKTIRKVLGIPPSDRSAIIFLSRALKALEHDGFLGIGPYRNKARRYMKLRVIVLD
jgi:hypothetical protein